jgi:epoxyqueuosine reductase
MPVDVDELRRRLTALGFDDVRFARVGPGSAPGAADFAAWLDAGNQADMAWLERGAAKRADPGLVLPGARSVVMLGVNYWSEALRAPAGAARWARYALYSDYHDTIRPALAAAGRALEELAGIGPEDHRYYVDTGPVLERGWAARAGLGFTGKNAMLISRRFGNWLFLAAILTRAELPPDEPVSRRAPAPGEGGESAAGRLCGRCTRCLDACPTNAFVAPGTVDARRCVSYLTIENRGAIPRGLRRGIGDRLYGCDTCLEVCPWNRFAREGRRLLLSARFDLPALTLREILTLTPERFAEVFRRTPVKRLKRTGLLRNACVVAGNAGATDCIEELATLARGAESVVRAHAVWALRRLGAEDLLPALRAAEADPEVLAEYEGEV